MTRAENQARENQAQEKEVRNDEARDAAPQTAPETATEKALEKTPETETEKASEKAPVPDAATGTLFDMRSKEEIAEEQRRRNMTEAQRKADDQKKKAEEQRKEAERKKREEEQRLYEAGTKLRYVGHLGRENVELPEPMTRKQIISYLQDDYPEVTEARAKFRYDQDKKQVVVTMGSFDKGRKSP